MADVTIILPTYNRLPWLKESLASIWGQGVPVQLIVIDNGCTDGTGEWLDSVGWIGDVIVKHLPENTRLSNLMYQPGDIHGKYVVLFTDDDIMLPGALAKKTAMLDANPALGFVYSRCRWMDADGNDGGLYHMGLDINYDLPARAADFRFMFHCDHVAMPSAMIRREALLQVVEAPGAGPAGDWQLWLSMLANGWQAGYLWEPTVKLRFHDGQETKLSLKDGAFTQGHLAIWRYWMIESPVQHRPSAREWSLMRSNLISVTPPELMKDALVEFDDLHRMVQPTLSIALIVKDEERNMERCLGSIQGLWDQLVIVDTGSTDKTKEIAQLLGAEVYDFEWTGNFAEARNYAMSKCVCDWILFLDADEAVYGDSHEIIRDAISSEQYDMYKSVMKHHYHDGRMAILDGKVECENGEYYSLAECKRLTRRKPGVHWVGRIHEAMTETGVRLGRSEFVIHHYGRMDTEREFTKRMIYLDIAMREHQDKPDDARCLFNYLMQANVAHDWGRMLDIAEIYIKRGGRVHAQISAMVGEAMHHAGRLEEAVNYLALSLTSDPHEPWTLSRMAAVLIDRGEIEEARSFLQTAIEESPAFMPAQEMLQALEGK